MHWFTITLIALLTAAPALGQEFAAGKLRKSDAAHTQGLTVVAFDLPTAAFAGDTRALINWHAYSPDGALAQLVITPNFEPDQEQLAGYTVYGLQRRAQATQIQFFKGPDQEPRFRVAVPLPQAKTGAKSLLKAWADARQIRLRFMLRNGHAAPPLRQLMDRAAMVYGVDTMRDFDGRRRFDPDMGPHVFSLLSGDAAIEETLQMQLLDDSTAAAEAAGTLDQLPGVEVPAHPYEEMLGGQAGGQLDIAALVPKDRYLVHITAPGKVMTWLDGAAETGWDVVSASRGQRLAHDLLDNYLARLHLNRELVRQLTQLGSVKQIALFGPDLYLDHGSELTIILDASQIPLVQELLSKALGVSKQGGVVAYRPPLATQAQAYYAAHEQWLILSTNRAEAEAALALARAGGQGSLGRSAEFRYLLSLLPRKAGSDGLFVYFSDPFIRAMVGPKIKIAQLRRAQARARLKLLTSAALLYKIDHGQWPTLKQLQKLGYVQAQWLRSWEGDELKLEQNGLARSVRYGTLAHMTPLSAIEIKTVSKTEKEAYEAYVREYTSYWRQFFDPIGIRVTVADPMEIETFILPLIENSIYAAVRETIGGAPQPLAAPALDPAPVATLSLKLHDKIRRELVQDFTREFRNFGSPIPSTEKLHGLLGDTIHFAVYDNDPILSFGSTDLMGAFSGRLFTGGGGGMEFFMLPLIATFFTQPASIIVETKDAAKLTEFIDQIPNINRYGRQVLEVARLGSAQDRGWVFSYQLFSSISLHLYVRILGDHVVVSNRQFDHSARAPRVNAPPANAAISLRLDALRAMQVPLHLKQMQEHARTALAADDHLPPMFWAGAGDLKAAKALHRRLYGTEPVHPLGVDWRWNPASGRLLSPLFGSADKPRLPSYFDAEARKPAGPFDHLRDLRIDFRFEDEGVRVLLRSKLNEP